jgi:Glycosyl hydrolase family 57
MTLWHQTGDAPCRVSFGDGAWWLDLEIGTWPVEAGQSVSIVSDEERGVRSARFCEAIWKHNKGLNGYWHARLGPLEAGDNVEYSLNGRSANGEDLLQMFSMHIGPKLLLAILWHQHQPMYRDCAHSAARGSFMLPWVRLHSLRDYYSMAALLSWSSASLVTSASAKLPASGSSVFSAALPRITSQILNKRTCNDFMGACWRFEQKNRERTDAWPRSGRESRSLGSGTKKRWNCNRGSKQIVMLHVLSISPR